MFHCPTDNTSHRICIWGTASVNTGGQVGFGQSPEACVVARWRGVELVQAHSLSLKVMKRVIVDKSLMLSEPHSSLSEVQPILTATI
jgi:hypothetical protein